MPPPAMQQAYLCLTPPLNAVSWPPLQKRHGLRHSLTIYCSTWFLEMQKKSIIKFNEYHNTGPDPAPQKPQLTKMHKIRASKNDEEYSLALRKMHNVRAHIN